MATAYHVDVVDVLPPGTMSIEAVAERAHLTVRSVASYLARGDMPAPEYRVGRSPLWKAKTIETWLAGRPGKGWRAGGVQRGLEDAAAGRTKRYPSGHFTRLAGGTKRAAAS